MGNSTIRQYVVDAFTDRVFSGNPAAICILDSWLPDELMMSITRENNLSETAFAVKNGGIYDLRWFTPGGEIDLCGHATLACAFILLNFYEQGEKRIIFSTMSGRLTVNRRADLYEMDFPAYDLKQVPVSSELADALGAVPSAAYLGRDLLCVFESADTVRGLSPDLEKLKGLDGLLLHATSRADAEGYDCVSHIIPYWAKELLRDSLTAYQASSRGGVLYCRLDGKRVIMAGKAALYSRAELHMPT